MLIIALAMLAAAQATPFPVTPTQVVAMQTASSDADARKVCRSNIPTGSHFAKKVCHTIADWKAVDAENERIGRATNAGRNGMQSEPFAKQRF
jgi:hypothetical protein